MELPTLFLLLPEMKDFEPGKLIGNKKKSFVLATGISLFPLSKLHGKHYFCKAIPVKVEGENVIPDTTQLVEFGEGMFRGFKASLLRVEEKVRHTFNLPDKIVHRILEANPKVYEYIPEIKKSYPEFIDICLLRDPGMIAKFPKKFLSEDIIFSLIKKNPRIYSTLDESLRTSSLKERLVKEGFPEGAL